MSALRHDHVTQPVTTPLPVAYGLRKQIHQSQDGGAFHSTERSVVIVSVITVRLQQCHSQLMSDVMYVTRVTCS